MIRGATLQWFGLVLTSSLTACSGTPISIGSGTDEVVSSTDDNQDDNDNDGDGMFSDSAEMPSDSDDMPSDGDGETPPNGGCELGGVYYDNGQPIPSMDCNSRWCQDGMIATTLVQCGVTLDECESALAACRMTGSSMTCEQEYDVCAGQVMPEGNPTSPSECENALAACRMAGTSMTCDQDYTTCIEQAQPHLEMCEAAVAACVESGEDAMTCVSRYNCDGEPTSPDECETLQAECYMNNGMACDDLYNVCIARMDPPPETDMCHAAIEQCVANGESEAACQMRYAGCGAQVPTPQDCEDAFTYCQTSPMPVACEETYATCMANAEPLTAAQCQAERETCEANGMSMTCTQDYNICLTYAEE